MLPIIGTGIGIIGGIGKMIGRSKANRELRRLQASDPTYQANPLAAQRLAYATALRDARMPGAAAAERNILGGMGNTIASAQRNATDASQVLAMAAAAQGQAQQGFNQLSMQEAADQQRRLTNWEQALQGQIGEEDKAFSDEIRRFGNRAQIQGAINQNRQATWGDISSLGFGLADFAQQGGFDSLSGLFNKPTPQGQNPMQIDQFGLGMALADIRNRLPKTIKSPTRLR